MIFEGEIIAGKNRYGAERDRKKKIWIKRNYKFEPVNLKKLLFFLPLIFTLFIAVDWIRLRAKIKEMKMLYGEIENKELESAIMSQKILELKNEISKLEEIQKNLLSIIEEKRKHEGEEIFLAHFEDRNIPITDRMNNIVAGFYKLYDELSERNMIIEYLPTLRPVNGYISSGFGSRNHPVFEKTHFHKGVDIVAPTGTPVAASASGKVIFVGQTPENGKTVKIRHINNITTTYVHLKTIMVKKGEFVKKGEIIGTVGSTGIATGPHLHYEISYKGKPIDPTMLMLE